jgi:hypothetical protein
MARIIIGSSNVKRFYSHAKFKAYQPYKMELCTINRMFEITMESIPDEAKVILSVVENFLEKELTQAKDEDGKTKSLTGDEELHRDGGKGGKVEEEGKVCPCLSPSEARKKMDDRP